MKRSYLSAITGLLLMVLFFTSCAGKAGADDFPPDNKTVLVSGDGGYTHLRTSDTIGDLLKHPAFTGFSRLLLPWDNREYDETMRLNSVSSLMPYHSQVNLSVVVESLNYMIDKTTNGETIFYDFYTNQQKREDPAKNNTGIFFYRGKPGSPFAIVCPGGGFSYVGSLHEGFPLALEISKKGYNAFIIKYRTGGERIACEDLAAAISYIFANAEGLNISTEDYSLWGGSAGARMAARLASYGIAAYGEKNLPKPGMAVIAYTGHTDWTQSDPPTFTIVGEQDGIANPATMERRVNAMKAAGIDTEFHLYRNLGHGFGTGVGTTAEGWIDYAVRFWEKHIKEH